MDEILKEIMGESYKEGMSKDDVQAFFKNQVLASGDYVNKGKANAESQKLNAQISDLQSQLEAKMSDDDKKKKADEDAKKLIADLQKKLAESQAAQSKMSATSKLAAAKLTAGIKDDDKEFDSFLSEISFEDGEKTNRISDYVSKLVKTAYEAGKSETTKKGLGKMGSFKEGQEGASDEKGAFGKQLAQATKVETKGQKDFFERK
jgi:hypothetical protein